MADGKQYDITVEQGATKRLLFYYRVKDRTGVMTPIDLTGWTGKAQIRRQLDPGSDLLGSFNIRLDPKTGRVWATLSAATTAGITDNGFYDIKVTTNTGEVIRLVQGRVTVTPGVTV